jgi:hypothetical protein
MSPTLFVFRFFQNKKPQRMAVITAKVTATDMTTVPTVLGLFPAETVIFELMMF